GSEDATLTDTTFENNTAEIDLGGGAYFTSSEDATLTNTTFENNKAYNGGGASFTRSKNATLANTTFENNTASNSGGGAYFYDSANNATLTDTTFENNTAYNGGGASFLRSENAVIKNCLFDNDNNFYAYLSPAILNETTPISGTNIAGGPFLGGNVWLRDPAQNISEWGADVDFDGICDEGLIITGLGTDAYPLFYGGMVNVSSVPAYAFVHLDGVNTTRTTNSSLYLPVGEYTLELVNGSYYGNQTVQIKAKNTTQVTFTLSPVDLNITSSPTDGIAPLTVSFSGSSTGNAADRVNWSFGYGEFSESLNSEHTYNDVGAYTATLNASWGAFVNLVMLNQTVKINVGIPAPTLRLSPTEGFAPLSAGVEVEGPGEPDSWNLSLGDGRWINGTGSDAINGTVNYAKAGKYTLRLNVSANGFFNETNDTINVGMPAPTLRLSPTEGFAPFSAGVEVEGPGEPDSWNLSLGDGRWINGTGSDAINGTVDYAKAGEYTLRLNVSANGFFNETNDTINVGMPAPTLRLTPTEGFAPFSAGVEVEGPGEPDSWNLSLGDGRWINGTGSDAINGTVNYAKAGEYALRLNVSANGFFNETNDTINVGMPVPTLRLSPTEGFAPLSAGVEAESLGNPDSWNLSLGDGRWINGTGSDDINGTVNYAKAGEYTLRLNVSANGFFNETNEIINVGMPVPTLRLSPTEGLAPFSAGVEVEGLGEPDSWNLSLGDGRWINGTGSDDINGTVNYAKAGEYTLRLNVSANGFFNETNDTITVGMPVPTLRLTPTEGFAPFSAGVEVGGPGEPDSWNLSLGDGRWINGTSSDEINGTVNYAKVGEYTLRLNVSANGFFNETNDTITVGMPVPTLRLSPTEGFAPLSAGVEVGGPGEPDS
ncbi:MAG: NosD domain-containing protein, partial [Methanosarcinaceae archaeon]|nr:NosD domain-containing protein [Methanosarcinaceae archaeon]